MFKGFRDFILRGNVVDLAVAVVIGAAFGAIVTALVSDIINPLLAAIVHKPDFSFLVLDVNGGKVQYGLFLNALISFVLIASTAGQIAGAFQTRGSCTAGHEDLPGMPERYPCRRQALLALHTARRISPG
jgi:hypothetical protein